jgi:hypothetical protein
MSKITHHNDENGNDKFKYSHDSCPTCQDRLIVARVVCWGIWGLHLLQMLRFLLPWMTVPMGWSRRVGEEVSGRWIHSYQVEEWRHYGITSPQSSVQVFNQSFCGPLGKGVWMQLPDCCLKGIRSLLKNKNPNEVYTGGFKPTSKHSKCS